jgi:ribosomal protein S18 acetylase RimI-like enzyme
MHVLRRREWTKQKLKTIRNSRTMPILSVNSPDQIAEVVRLAQEIWPEHYTPIIGQKQVNYMLEKFQSQSAIAGQIRDGYEYYLATRNGQNAGYAAIIPNPKDATLMLSKLYVRSLMRGNGIGRSLLQFVEELCRKRGFKALWLTVNKNNGNSIAWYTRMGFLNTDSVVQDIGAGFVTDDFRLEKAIP